MPFTDDILDGLEQLSDDEALKFFDALTDDERLELDGALSTRKTKALVPGGMSMADGSVGVGQKAPEVLPPPLFRPPESLATRPNPYLKGEGATHNARVMASADTAEAPSKAAMSDAAVTLGQENVGLPIAKTLVDISQDEGPKLQRAGRLLLTPIAGPKIQSYKADPVAGRAAMGDTFGSKPILFGASGADIVEGAIEGAGNPVNYTPLGVEGAAAKWAAHVAKAAPTWGRIVATIGARSVAAGVENATIEGGISLATNKENIGSRMFGAGVAGSALKPLFHTATGGLRGDIDAAKISPVPGTPKPIKLTVVVEPHEIKPLLQEARSLPHSGEVSKPIAVTIDIAGLGTGKLEGVITGPDKTGQIVTQRFPLDNGDQSVEFMRRSNLAERDGALVDDGVWRRIYGGTKHKRTMASPENFDYEWPPNAVEAAKRARGEGSAQVPGNGTRAERPSGRNEATQAIGGQAEPQTSVILQEGESGLEITHVRHVPEKTAHDYSIGDSVVVDGPRGGTQVYGVLREAGEDGRLVVQERGTGTKHTVLPHQVRVATAADKAPLGDPIENMVNALKTSREMSLVELQKYHGGKLEEVVTALDALEQAGTVEKIGSAWKPGASVPRLTAAKLPPGPGIAETKGVTPSQPALRGGPPTPEEMPALTAGLDEANSLARQMLQHDVQRGGKFTQWMRDWLDPQMRGLKNLHHHMRETRSQRMWEEIRALEEARLRRLLPNVKTEDAFDKDFNRAIRTKDPAAINAIMEKHGDVWRAVQDEANRLIAEKATDNARFKQLTGFDFEDPIDADIHTPEYVARRYWAFLKPKEWQKLVLKRGELLDQAVKGVLADNPDLTPGAVAQQLRSVLHSADPIAAYKGSGLPYGSKSMLKRQELPEYIRKLLGENESGIMNLAESRATQKAILHTLEAWDAITRDPGAFTREPGNPLFRQLPNDQRKYGPAAGGYVHEELFDALVTATENAPQTVEWARAFQKFLKGNQTAWNPRAHLRSIFGNLDSSVAAGGMNPLNPVDWRLMAEAWQALKAFKADPTADGVGKIVFEAKKYGADYAGYGSQEIASLHDKAFAEFNRVHGANVPKNALDWLGVIANTGKKLYTKPTDSLAGLLDFQDRLFRIANYIGLRRKLIAKGMTPEDAARESAERINRYFWNTQNIGRHVERARRGGVGVVAPYLTPIAEDARTRLNMARGMATEDWGFRGRMAAWHGIFYGGLLYGGGAAWKAINGTDGDELDDAKARQTKSSQTFKPLQYPLPWRDSEGRVQAFDYTPFSYPGQFLRGYPDDHWMARAFANAATMPFGEFVGTGVRTGLEATGAVTPVQMPTKKLLEGEAGVSTILGWMSEQSLLPVGPARLSKDVGRLEDLQASPYDVPLTPGQVAGRQLFGVEPVPPTMLQRASEMKRETQEAGKAIQKGAQRGTADMVEGGKKRIKFLADQFKGKKQ